MKLRNVPKWKYNRIVIISLSDNDAARRLRFTPLLTSSKFPAFSASKCLQNSSIIQNNSVTLQSVVISNIFVTCCNSPVKVQNICETTNFFMNYFLSRTGVEGYNLTSEQELYLKDILNFISKNGDIETRDFLEYSLNNLKWRETFGDTFVNLKDFIRQMHWVIIA